MATVLCSATNGPHEYACAYCQEPIPLGKAISAPIITELPEPTIVHRSVRYRVNVSISTKGQKVWDCTCDAEGCDMAEVLAMSDALVAELEKRYPANVEK